MIIRPETKAGIPVIYRINELAFAQPGTLTGIQGIAAFHPEFDGL